MTGDTRLAVAMFCPEIPGNVGAILRLSACFGIAAHIIEPCGFAFCDKRLRRAAMDYIDHVDLVRHADWTAFREQTQARVILLTTRATTRLPDFAFAAGDVLLLGQESAGVPDAVRAQCDASVRIPLMPHVRSLNVAVAAGIGLGEALRQTGGLPA